MSYLNSRRLSILLLLGIAAVLIASYTGIGKESESSGSNTVRVEVSYGFEAKDEEKLVGFAENVFTGRCDRASRERGDARP